MAGPSSLAFCPHNVSTQIQGLAATGTDEGWSMKALAEYGRSTTSARRTHKAHKMKPAGFKETLNHQATRALRRLGYSDASASDAKREGWWWLQARIAALRRRSAVLGGRAVVWTAPGAAELVGWDVAAAGPGELTIELLSTTVSPGTERAQFLRLPNTRIAYPSVPGYSGSGIVLSRGRGVTEFQIGELVALAGAPHASIVTTSAIRAVRVPESVSATAASTAYLGAIALHGVDMAAIAAGSRVLVVGSGMIGLLAARIAAARGAEVSVMTRSPRSDEVAAASGEIRFVLVDDASAAPHAEIVIEATGDPNGITTAIKQADERGRVIVLGSPRGATAQLPLDLIQERGLELIGAHIETAGLQPARSLDDAVREQMRLYLQLLAEGLPVDDLLAPADPREPALLYRSLQQSRARPGVYFDWERIPRSERVSGALLRAPSLRAVGVEPSPAPSRPRRPDRTERRSNVAPVRFGLIGCGDIGSVNAAALAAEPSARLVACFDTVTTLAADVAGQHEAQVVESIDALVERPDVDVVLICVPHFLHPRLALRAIEAGKNVIVEKPLSADLDGALQIVEAAERAGVLVSTCFPHRHDESVERARDLVREQALGEVRGAFVSYFADKSDTYWHGGYSGRSYSDWRLSREQAGGGTLIMNLCHYVDLVRHVAGLEAELVSAVTGSIEPGTGDVEDTVSVSVQYEHGAVGSFFGTAAARGMRNMSEVRLWGPEGTLMLEPAPQIFSLHSILPESTSRWSPLRRGTVDIRERFVQRFVESLRCGTNSVATVRDGLAVQAVIEAAYRSAATGEAVDPKALLTNLAALSAPVHESV